MRNTAPELVAYETNTSSIVRKHGMRRLEQGQGILMLDEVKIQVKITSLVRFEEEQQIALTHTAQSITILS